ncbi:MAG: Bifunctional NAD(P)H-hydrate repair enzyme Nnr [Chloroflexi bacterium]|nr:Bifunctional NAD(P)H-hydrate repair enzyme Nnr [Chloroflexota bacterium]
MKITTVSEMQNMDKTAIEDYGIPDEILMENAGLAVYGVLRDEIGIAGKRFLIFCGMGNNGGDGLVVARQLHANGGWVKVYLMGDPARYTGAAATNYEIISRLPVEVEILAAEEDVEKMATELAHCDAVVDALLGTGITREVGGRYRSVVESLNRSGKPVVAVDIPSGVNGDTGQVMGVAVRADFTVTFGLPKIGNLLYPGYELGGQLYVTHISFPPALTEAESLKVAVNQPLPLPPRPRDAHKGSMGQALFIAGAAGYYGAPYFAAFSFLKAGGGYSRLASPSALVPFIANKGSEIVFLPQRETDAGSISLANKEALLETAAGMDMVVLGPGLSLAGETQQLARELAREIEKPLLLDGDGITALCQELEIIKYRTAPTILTPHLGEMSRLTGLTVDEIDADKVEILQRTCRDLGTVIVLKGAHSLVGYPNGRVFVNLPGNPGMATAGSGDVLTGTIAAMHGLGLSVEDAVRQGVYVHGLSGDLAAEDMGEDGITAQDILEYLPSALKTVRSGLSPNLQDGYASVRVL